MIVPDVNVLVAAHNDANAEHEAARAWLTASLASAEPLGIPSGILAGFVRVATNPRILNPPLSAAAALEILEVVRGARPTLILEPGPEHWEIFASLCRATNARGGMVQDAYWAAFAIERAATFVTLDGDFARFPGLIRWDPRQPRRV